MHGLFFLLKRLSAIAGIHNVPLLAEDYIDALDNSNDRIFLFTTSEEYGSIQYPPWRSLLHE